MNKFFKCNEGNVAAIFAFSLIPIFGAAGAAVDYSRLSENNAMIQEVLDASTLAAAIEFQETGDKKKAKKAGKKMFNAQCYMPYCAQVKKPKFKFPKSGEQVVGTAKAALDTTFIHLLGKSKWKFKVRAAATIGATGSEPFELAIVMDTTSSMSSYGGNWPRAVKAFSNMMQAMKKGQKSGTSTVGFVPFGDRVNVGTKLGSKWHNVSGSLTNWQGCLEPREKKAGGLNFMLDDTPPNSAPFKPTAVGFYGPVNNGGAPSCPQKLSMPTTKPSKIENDIKSISPSGTGRFDVGLAWGWRMLSPKWQGKWGLKNYPKDYGKKRKLIIFMSDGYTYAYEREVHSYGPSQPWGWNKGTPEAFKHFAQLCENIKDEGIELHMIYMKGNENFKPIMKGCATEAANFYESANVKDLEFILNEISKSSTNVRLTM